MVAGEPRVRRRGFFLHSSDGNETDLSHGSENENPEGVTVRIRVARPSASRQMANSGRSSNSSRAENTNPQIRSGSVTGSRQRSHMPR
jgi:hypothetical protein